MGSVKIKNPDGSKHAFGTTNVVGPGVNKSVTIPSQVYSCGHAHTLTGKQESLTEMKGTGVNPWPDPGQAAQISPTGGVGPSWEATTGGPEPTK